MAKVCNAKLCGLMDAKSAFLPTGETHGRTELANPDEPFASRPPLTADLGLVRASGARDLPG